MKVAPAHWVSILLGAMVIGLSAAAGQLTGTPKLVANIIIGIAGAVLPALGVTSPSALKESPAAGDSATDSRDLEITKR